MLIFSRFFSRALFSSVKNAFFFLMVWQFPSSPTRLLFFFDRELSHFLLMVHAFHPLSLPVSADFHRVGADSE